MAAQALPMPGAMRAASGRRASWRLVAALALSLVAHVTFIEFAKAPPPEPLLRAPGSPLTVELNPAPSEPQAAVAPQPQVTAPSLPAPRPVRRAPVPRHELVVPQRVEPPPVAERAPAPAPQVDMMAMIRERQAERRAAEAEQASEAHREQSASGLTAPRDAGLAALNRNLRNLSGDDGIGGVFQILHKGTLSGEYAFNGWRPDTHRRWREVIEVRAGPDGDIERAFVRSMIALIRGHYTGDFQWESRRLGRVVRLSARPEDNEGLEDFLLREFFGTPTLNRPDR